MGDKCWVLCLNDYPHKVYLDETKANNDLAEKRASVKNLSMQFWHLREVPLCK